MAGESDNNKDTGDKDFDLDQLNNLLDDQGGELQDDEDEADFNEAFESDSDSSLPTPEADDDDDDKDKDKDKGDDDDTGDGKAGDDDAGTDANGGADGSDADAGSDADDGNAPAAKDADDDDKPHTALEEKQAKRIRALEGRFGELNSKINILTDAAKLVKKEVSKDGTEVPTGKVIAEAMKDGEKFAKLKDEFPEFAESLEESIGLSASKLLESMPDVDALEAKITERVTAQMGIKELDRVHKGWQNTVNTEEFLEWAHEDGPTKVERDTYYSLNSAEDAKAAPYRDKLCMKYPEWALDKGSLLLSDDPNDCIDMLDQFSESKAAPDDTGDKGRSKRRNRLESNTSATKNTRSAPKPRVLTDDEEFEQEFNS